MYLKVAFSAVSIAMMLSSSSLKLVEVKDRLSTLLASYRFILSLDIAKYQKDFLLDALGNSSSLSSEDQVLHLRQALETIVTEASPMDPSRDSLLLNVTEDTPSWYELHDGVMGGVSEGRLTPHSTREALFAGHVRTDFNGGFASVRRKVDWDASEYSGIFLDARCEGAGRDYALNIKDSLCTQMGGVNFRAKFTPSNSPRRFYFPFKDFTPEFRGMPVQRAPLDRGDIREVSLMAMKPAGEFRLFISAIGLYNVNDMQQDL